MNISALKGFATEARSELHEKIQLQALKLGITSEAIQQASLESSNAIFIDGKPLSEVERKQRNKLITRINEIGYDEVIKETAYTWFNRFIALRYMEVNDYLPTKVRVLSSVNPDSTEPDMFKEALNLDLPIDKEHVYNLKMENKTDELFKYLIKVHCNDLNRYMPFMFEELEDYKEILFPEGIFSKDSFISRLTDLEIIAENNWKNVEIIGWLYQYYISEEKDNVFLNLKNNIKIAKEKIPAATQLFTPNWIVKYMVENSLGHIWAESNPNSHLKNKWEYFLVNVQQNELVIKQINELHKQNLDPEKITFLDPCCGSGHILVYAFDVFYDMYLEKGYMENEIPQLILENNIFGLDIDDRATQLASFALMMKARQKSRRFFRNKIKLNVTAVQESNWLSENMITLLSEDNQEIKNALVTIKKVFLDAKEYGSLLSIEDIPVQLLRDRVKELQDQKVDLIELIDVEVIMEKISDIILQVDILGKKYDVVCTNPPYMGNKGMDIKLANLMKKNFPNTKSDLSTAFMERSLSLTKSTGMISMINIPVWMFLTSYEKLRWSMISNNTILSMLHLGRGVFGSDFGTTAFVVAKARIEGYKGIYRKLFEKPGAVDSLEQKQKWFFEDFGYYKTDQEEFKKIPGNPIAYWVSKTLMNVFKNGEPLSNHGKPVEGIKTGNNDRFLRLWHEINFNEFGMNFLKEDKGRKWYPISKGGSYRKWYGNNEYVINWLNDGEELDKYPGSSISNRELFNYPALTWTYISAGKFSMRYLGEGYLYNNKGPACYFEDENKLYYILGLNNSKIIEEILVFLSSTVDYKPGNIKKIPVLFNEEKYGEIIDLVKENISISKDDWDSFETSWNFSKHPLLMHKCDRIESSFEEWANFKQSKFSLLKANEEEINRIFLEIYDLQDEITANVNERDVTINKASHEREIKSLISYFIGCIFGRYSLDKGNLVYAGGKFDLSNYKSFLVKEDNIVPIDVYFEKDIVTKFVDFVQIIFSKEKLEENLEFIADALDRKKNETPKEVLQRYFVTEFYKDHLQVYQKRPIYWLFTSGKEKAFNCLIYMHRYDKTTLSRIRTDYVHEVQNRMDAEKNDLLNIINSDSTVKEIAVAKKELKSLEKKIDELKKYDELLHHMADQQIEIDLDDGVKHNYELFKGLVAKI